MKERGTSSSTGLAAPGGQPSTPAWAVECAAAFTREPTTEPIPLPESLSDHPLGAVLVALEPLITRGCDRLTRQVRERLHAQAPLPVEPDGLARLFLPELASRLLGMASQTVILELHVARIRGELEGDSPERRWNSFVRRLCRTSSILALLREYPVLARQLIQCIDQWVETRVAFVERLCTDWKALHDCFRPTRDPGPLVRLIGNPGDTHHGGQSVLIAEFTSGFRLVYKPRSMAVDVHFQELLAWVNARGQHTPLPLCRVLDRGAYGWAEFVPAHPCASREEVRRFYRRTGGYLALLHGLCATDIHAENLIAAGEYPFLVDLEALFHPALEGLDGGRLGDAITRVLEDSVLRVGLLPERRGQSTGSDGIDLSGLSATPGQLTPTPVRTLDAVGTDLMRYVRRRMPFPGSHNRPTLNGSEVNVLEYREDVAAGFEAVYRLLLRHRDELLASDGPLQAFADDEVRYLVRDTQTYAQLLQYSFHPEVLRDALDRDRLFDQLWSRAEQDPTWMPVVAAERRQLLQGDIPRFTTRAGSRDLRVGRTRWLPEFIGVSGLAMARQRLSLFREEDLQRQLWFIRGSFANLALTEDEGGHEAVHRVARIPSAEPLERERLLTAARAIGDGLARLAITGTNQVTWLGVRLTARHQWTFAPLGMDFYDGVPGIALFLAFLGEGTDDASYTRLAESALETVRSRIAEDPECLTSVGGYTGWGGLIYCLTRLGALWEQPELLAEAEAHLARLPALIERDEELDVLSGAAGCIGALLTLHDRTASPRALDAAIRCGDRLIETARPMEEGIGWCTGGRTRALTGFSHGAAGMAWALLELSARTGLRRFHATALDALTYERRQFVPDAGNWPDLRRTAAAMRAEHEGRRAFVTAWCHGAPGIGLARLCTLAYLDDAVTRAEIDAALHTTASRGFGRNHSLCHGDLGNIELLREAGERLGDPRWTLRAQAETRALLERGERHGWKSGAPCAVESPGLMTGLAGIGYGLLRLASPDRVPSVLTLVPPSPYRNSTSTFRSHDHAITQHSGSGLPNVVGR